jgi:hypothetical protein
MCVRMYSRSKNIGTIAKIQTFIKKSAHGEQLDPKHLKEKKNVIYKKK